MSTLEFDFKQALSPNRLVGLWRMMRDFRRRYAGAVAMLALATGSKTATFYLIRFLVDEVLAGGRLNLELKDVAAAYSVITRDFIDALGLM